MVIRRIAHLFALLLMAVLWMGSLTQAAPPRFGLLPQDTAPLNDKIPLILVHGINPDPAKDYNWQGFLALLKKDRDFQGRFKTYHFVFPPAKPIRENSQALQSALSRFLSENPQAKPFRFAALSLGGLLVKDALYQPALFQQTDRVVAIGVPFHGSPLASKAWTRAGCSAASFLNPVRYVDEIAYAITEREFPHFAQDYCWDNFDGNLPEAIARKQTCMIPTSIHRPEEERSRYVTYAGFFGASVVQRQWLRKRLGLEQPQKALGTKTILMGKHFMFSMVQPCLAALPLSQPAENGVLPMTAFNDGISPISSQLWLGRYVHRTRDGQPIFQQALWQAVENLKTENNARLFDGLDHRDWLEGESRYEGDGGKLADWLHAEEPARTIFEWIKYDLTRD